MNNKNRRLIPNMPHSISAAAKALDTEKEFLIKWMQGGEIRACVDYADFDHAPSYTAAYVNDGVNLKEVHKQYSEEDYLSTTTNADEDESYPVYFGEYDFNNCPLNKLFSTTHSKIDVISFNPQDSGSSGVIGGYIHGLWQINSLWQVDGTHEVKDLFNLPGNDRKFINVVPYIPEGLYYSQVNKEQCYISGFQTEISVDDIRISYDDMLRVRDYLDGEGKLAKLNEINELPNKLDPVVAFTPTELSSVVIGQLLYAYCPFFDDLIKHPRAAIKRLEEDFAVKGLMRPQLSEKTLDRILKKAQKYLPQYDFS